MTVFSKRELRLARLWARGVHKLWPDHPPIVLLSDGTTDADELRSVAELCDATIKTDDECRECLRKNLETDINDLAQRNFWVRNLYLPSLICDASILVWDDTDGLFMRRPDSWIKALKDFPNACTSIWKQGYGIVPAHSIWLRVNPELARVYRIMAPVHGTHSAPPEMIRNSLRDLAAYHRRWMEQGEQGGGSVSEMGAWQGVAASWRPGVVLSTINYQIDYLQLQTRPEVYHACTEKNAEWFWESFLSGYETHIDNPKNDFAACSWLGENKSSQLMLVPTV